MTASCLIFKVIVVLYNILRILLFICDQYIVSTAVGLSLFRVVWTNPSVLVPTSKLIGLRASVT